MPYYTLANTAQLTEEIKKSRFIVYAARIVNPEQAAEFIKNSSDLSATHNCWAWKIGQQYRFSDDGEPSGTAGRPILSAIEGQNCDQVAVVIVRYFGGIKLGTGGLMRAYGNSASHCLQQADLVELIERIYLTFHCYYNEWPLIENRLKELDGVIEQQDFDEQGIHIKAAIEQDKLFTLQNSITNITRGRVLISD